MIKEIDGDLIKLAKNKQFDVIVHGCNCKRNMGAGIALQIAKEFPEAENLDKNTTKNKLGNIDCVYIKEYNITIVNAYTQHGYGKSNTSKTQNTRYNAIINCMKEINNKFKGKKVGLPLIGCGLAGGDWDTVRKIIEKELCDCDATIVHYKKY